MHRISEFRRPIDARYAFQLREQTQPSERLAHPLGQILSVDKVRQAALIDGDSGRFTDQITAWNGPEDVDDTGAQPYLPRQTAFAHCDNKARLDEEDLHQVLTGTVRVMRSEQHTDYVMRDHHMLDTVLYHYATTGELPSSLFHADRHSDWCRDGYLNAHKPAQAATWWTLLEGLKRPVSNDPVLAEDDVVFTTDQPSADVPLAGRDVGASLRVPWWVDKGKLGWADAMANPKTPRCDWVSLDLDYFQPIEQLKLTKGILRHPVFHQLMSDAKVRVFVLSPQFTAGGDVLQDWTIGRRKHASLRMLNLVRQMRMNTTTARER